MEIDKNLYEILKEFKPFEMKEKKKLYDIFQYKLKSKKNNEIIYRVYIIERETKDISSFDLPPYAMERIELVKFD